MKTGKILAALAAAICLMVFAVQVKADVQKQETEKYGKITEIRWVDETGAPAPGPDGYARVTYKYEGSEITERYYSVEGLPYRAAGGYCGKTVTRDSKRRITGIVYLDESGQKAENDLGYARVRIDYTSFSEVKYLSFYGAGKSPVLVPSLGYASVKTEFRGKTMTRRTWLDEKGNPIDTPKGYAAQVQRVNKKNQVLGVSFEHADGSPATCEDGWSSCANELDEAGRVLSVKYYTADGSLTDRGAGYAWERTEYREGNETRITRYDLNGELTEAPGGYSTLCQVWQEEKIVRETFLNAEGQRILNRDGVGAIRYTYDHAGRVTQVSYEDLNGAPCLCQNGYCGYRDTLDDNGQITSRVFLGADGLPMDLAAGYSEIRYAFDEAGTLLNTRYFNSNGIQVE